jgi:hypothetical protein
MATKRRIALVALAAAAAIALAGCVPTEPMPTPTGSGSPTPTPTPTVAPTFVPNGTVEENYEFFRYLVEKMYFDLGKNDGAQYINMLTNYGFDRTTMEVTYNETAIGEQADSIIFSVRYGGECFIGQIFNPTWVASRAPILGTGTCLIGVTRPIDF